MVTNQIMKRKMGNIEVFQRTKDGFFNGTSLLDAWNRLNPNEQRRMDKFWDSTHIDKLMLEIVVNEPHLLENFKFPNTGFYKNTSENQQLPSSPKLGDDKSVSENQSITTIEDLNKFDNFDFNILKNLVAKTSKANKGANKGTWLHPIMFIKFAMYLSPRFEYYALKFIHDEMIKYRNLAGDSYRELASAVSKIVPKEFMPTAMKKVAEALNHIIFSEHRLNIRNDFGEEEKQKELFALQDKISMLINEGFIPTYEKLIDYLRETYRKNTTPKVFYIEKK